MATQPTQNAVPSESYRDLKFNAGKIDEFVTSLQREYEDRFGKKHYTIEGLRWVAQQAISTFGYITLDSFEDGNNLTLPNQVLRLEATGEYYRWDGEFPKDVPAGSTPDSTGGVGIGKWLSVGDATLRSDLESAAGAGMVGTTLGGTVQKKLEDVLSAQYRERNIKLLAQFQYKCRTKQSVKIVCQGDSITAGMDTTSTDVVPPTGADAIVNPTITHATIEYPARLGVFMNYVSGIPVTVVNQGVSGHTAKEGYEYWTTNPNADVVFLMYGINDADPINSTHEEYMQYMELLIRRYIDWGCGVVIMACASGGTGRTDPLFQKFAQQAKSMATVFGCAYMNANEVLYYIPQGAVEADGTHLNSAGYSKLGEAVAGFILAGGVLSAYKPLSQETFFWPSMQSDTVGFYDALGSFETLYNDGSFILQKIVGRMVAGTPTRISFSFYLDADAAEVDVIGQWSDLDVVCGMTSEQVHGSVYPPYYDDVNPRSSPDLVSLFRFR